MNDNSLVMLGIGAAVGICGIFLIIELWPVLALGGAGYLICKGIDSEDKQEIE